MKSGACVAGVMLLPIAVGAQGWIPSRVGMETDAHAGVVSTSNSPLNNSTTNLVFRDGQAGLQTEWQLGSVEALASVSMAMTSTARVHTLNPLGSLRLVTQRGPVTLSFGVQQGMGVSITHSVTQTVINPDSAPTTMTQVTTSAALVSASDLVGAIGWTMRSAHLQLLTGLRTHNLAGDGLWAGIGADVDVGAGNAVTLMAMDQGQHVTIRSPDVSLGLRVTQWPWHKGESPDHHKTSSGTTGAVRSPLARVDATNDSVFLHLYLPDAHHVMVAGDATEWQPIAMLPEHAGWWKASLRRFAGISRIHVRSDANDWQPAPGLPMTQDEYGGMVSLLCAPPAESPSRNHPIPFVLSP